MNSIHKKVLVSAALFIVLAMPASALARVTPAGTAFTYQGQLKQDGNLVNATADFEFHLFDVPSGGSPLGAMFPVDNVTVTDGQFTVDLDFGAGAFNGDARWLDIAVRSPAGSGTFTPLTPRQPIHPAPMAQFAFAIGLIADPSLSGTYSNPLNLTNASNAFTGSGAGLTNLNASNISVGSLDSARLPTGGAWSLASNLNLDANTLLIDSAADRVGVGTSTPSQKFEVVGLNSAAATSGSAADGIARFHPIGSSAVLDIGYLSSPAHAWLQSRDSTDYATNFTLSLNPNGGNVGIGTTAPAATLHVVEGTSGMGLALPGLRVFQNATCPNVIGGSIGNEVMPGVVGATISGGGEPPVGSKNFVTDEFGTVGGGFGNQAGNGNVDPLGQWATVAGGAINHATGTSAAIGGGWLNTADGGSSTVGGGHNNHATGGASTVGGGGFNTASGDRSTVPGGLFNVAGGSYSFAAGRNAKVRDASQAGNSDGDKGTFVWADSTSLDFTSTGPNQFLIRASGGVGIGTTTPHSSYALTLRGDGVGSPEGGIGMYAGSNSGVFLGYPVVTDTTNFELWNNNNGYLRFGTNGLERLRITNAGRVGIGTSVPATGLHVQTTDSALRADSTSAGGIGVHAISSATTGGGIALRARVESATGYAGYFEGAAGSRNYFERMTGVGRVPQINMLEVEGTASKTTAGSWIANSDRRIKTDVRDLDDALNVIDRVRPVAFRYTSEYLAAHPSIEDVEYCNVIAQEFAEVFPDSVKESGETMPGVDGESILQVDVHPMLITTVAAVQQLHKIVREKDVEIAHLRTAHEAENTELRIRIESLEAMVQQLLAHQTGGRQ